MNKNEKKASNQQLLELVSNLAKHMPEPSADVVQDWNELPSDRWRQHLAFLMDGPHPLAQVKMREIAVTIYPKRTGFEWAQAVKDMTVHPIIATNEFNSPTYKPGVVEPYQETVVAFCAGRSMTTTQAKRYRRRFNLDPIGFEHMAAIGEQHPTLLQELRQIVDPDSRWPLPGGTRHISYFSYAHGKQSFDLYVDGCHWDTNTWYLGLKPASVTSPT